MLTPENGTALLHDLNTLSLHKILVGAIAGDVKALLSSRNNFRDKGFRLELTKPGKASWFQDDVERNRERLEAVAKHDEYMIEYTTFNRSFR